MTAETCSKIYLNKFRLSHLIVCRDKSHLTKRMVVSVSMYIYFSNGPRMITGLVHNGPNRVDVGILGIAQTLNKYELLSR